MTIFLTGATGYIGGAIAAKLVEKGCIVRGLVRVKPSRTELDWQPTHTSLTDWIEREA